MRKQSSTTSVTGLFFPALKSLPIAVLLLLGTTACSDDNIPDDNGTESVESTITVGNDPATQADRIFFYGNPETRTDDDGDGLGFPNVGSEPDNSVYENLTPISDISWNAMNNLTPGNYKLGDITLSGNNLYVKEGVNIYVYGTITVADNQELFINGKGKIYLVGNGSLSVKTDLNLQGIELYAYENSIINVPAVLKVTNNAKFLSKGVITVNKDATIEGGEFIAKTLNVEEGKLKVHGMTKATCINVVKSDVNVNSILVVRNHLNVEEGNLAIEGNGTIYLQPYAIVDVTKGTTSIKNYNGFKYNSYDGKDGLPCMVRTKGFIPNGIDAATLQGMFSGNLKIKYDTENMSDQLRNLLNIKDNNPDNDLILVSEDNYYVPATSDGCHTGNGTKPADSKDDENLKVFDPIFLVKNPNPTHSHTHLSATCVQPVDGNKAYISYHLNTEYDDIASLSNPYAGCVELFNLTSDGAAITSWLRNEDFDFNHMIIDGNKLYTVGDTKKYGATLGVVDINSDGSFGNYEMDTEGRADVMDYFNLYKKATTKNGSSGNCLIKNGNDLLFASYLGFQKGAFSENKLVMDENAFLSTTGSAKHIATDNNYIVTLNLNAKDAKSSTATINVYNAKGFTGFGNPITTITTKSEVTPIDGKNVVAVYGGYIYVALGETGVEKWSVAGGTEPVAVYNYNKNVAADKPHPRANGLDVDDKYVYVANGEGGLIVLDQVTMKPVGNFVVDWSANYVKKVGDYIYIAYGRQGLVIVKMRDNTANQA